MGGRHKDPEYHKKWWAANKHKYNSPRPHSDPDYQENYYKNNKEQALERQRRIREANPELRLYKSARYSARKRGLAFEIQVSDIVIPDVCPILKTPFQRFTDYTPSIDRIDNNIGYIKGNIQVVSKKANSMKYNANADELLLFAKWVMINYRPIHIEEVLSVPITTEAINGAA